MLWITLIVGISAVALFQLWPQGVIQIFGTGDALYLEFAVKTFRIYLSLTMVTCLVKMTAVFFQSIGKSANAMIASLVRDLVCFTPLALLLPALLEGAEPGSGINGILYAAPISDLVALAVILGLTVPFIRTLKKQEESTTE